MDILFYMLVTFGICFSVQQKVPFLHGKSDFLDAMLQCTFCTGFHCGWATWLLFWAATGHSPAEGWSIPASMLLWAFASAAVCYILDALTHWLETTAVGGKR